MKQITLISPFDAHMHWRQQETYPGTATYGGVLMRDVATYSMNQFSGGLLMPNIAPPITNLNILQWYREQTFKEINYKNGKFLPLFVFYLSKDISVSDLLDAWESKMIAGVKWYPKGGTTNSSDGIQGIEEVSHLLKAMEENNIPLLIHGEIPVREGDVVDDFERETEFMKTELIALRNEFPALRIVLEHITTEDAVRFVLDNNNVWATITPQHMLFDTRALFNGVDFNRKGFLTYDNEKNGMRPHHMCRPILKNANHVAAIRAALIEQHKQGFKKFGLGTDTAPHSIEKKHADFCACGVFSAPIALQMYVIAFDEMDILDHLQIFAGDIMPEFYGIKDILPEKHINLLKEPDSVRESYNGIVSPFAGQNLPWSVGVMANSNQ